MVFFNEKTLLPIFGPPDVCAFSALPKDIGRASWPPGRAPKPLQSTSNPSARDLCVAAVTDLVLKKLKVAAGQRQGERQVEESDIGQTIGCVLFGQNSNISELFRVARAYTRLSAEASGEMESESLEELRELVPKLPLDLVPDAWVVSEQLQQVLTMGVSEVTLSCRVDSKHALVRSGFESLSLPGRRCAHDLTDRYVLKVSMDQWTCVVSHASSVICLQAFVFPHVLDVSLEGGGVMPTPECRLQHPHGLKHVVEFFSGGFSGWSQVVRFLNELDLPLVTAFALDASCACVEAYSLTFGATRIGPDLKVDFDANDCLPLKKVIESDVMEFSWAHLLGMVQYEIGVCSPPCPPWSKASVSPPGLRRRDGALTPLAIALLALIGCKVVCMENVSGMIQHDHWMVIKRWIAHWGLDLRWSKVLDLAEIAPQKRERLLLLATLKDDEAIRPHVCVTWPKAHPPSLQQFDVLMQVDGHWLDECVVSSEILEQYLDPKNLPKQAGSNRTLKKSRIDMTAYRLRTPQEQMSCVMANYGAGHLLPDHTVQSGGLYGALLALPTCLRFASTPEIALLQITLGPLWIPANRKTAVSILGNSISTAHAGITILNALAFITDITHVEIADTFTRMIAARLRASMLAIRPASGGFWFLKSDIEPTLPLRECEQLVLRSPVDETIIHVQSGLNVLQVLEALLGESKPSEIFLAPAGNIKHKVLIKPSFEMPRDRTVLFASVQVALLIPVKSFGIFAQKAEFVIALCPFGLVVVARSRNMTILDVMTFLRGEFASEPLFATDMLGFELDRDALCPDAVVFLTVKGVQPADVSSLLALDVHVEHTLLGFDGMSGDIAHSVELLRQSGIYDLLVCLGWMFAVPIGFLQDGMPQTLQLFKCPQRLAIEGDDAKHCLAVILFISQWRTQAAFGENPSVLIKFKFWNSWVWEGTWDLDSDFSCVKTIWLDIMAKFHLTWEIRFIVNGQNANFQRPLREFIRPDQTMGEIIKVYLVVSLHGGGPKGNDDQTPKSSGLKRKLPPPPPMPNTTEQPPTPPSVPGTPPEVPTPPSVPGSPVHPPTPPRPPRLVRTDIVSEESSSPSPSASVENAPAQAADPLSFQDVFRLDMEDREQALMIALHTWMNLTRIDWDVDMFAVSDLRLTIERNLLFWDGPFPKLMKFIQFFQQTRLEFMFEKLGWILTVKFLEFSNPVRGRLLFIPHPVEQVISQKTFYMIMQAALVILALPRGVQEAEDAVFTKIKVWGHPAFQGWLPCSMHVAFLLDPWELVGRMVGKSLPMRAVAAPRTMNPDFQLGHYAKKDSTGRLTLTVHFVLGLQGGGPMPPPNAESLVKQKNALATFLLSQGADFQELAAFVDKILKASSPATIESLLKPRQVKEKLDGIVKLAKALSLSIPTFHNEQQKHREKIRDRIQKPANEVISTLNLETIQIKEGFFKNEDATPCQQRFDVAPKETGVCLMSPSQALPWLTQTTEVSQDELAIVVLGRCECSSHSKGRRVQIPAFCGNHEPLVLAGCLHDLGKKKVQTTRAASNIATTESAVVSFTVCRDELPPEKWEDFVRSPVKATLDLCCPELVLLAPPWGRIFQREKVKVPSDDATSLQFHARISKSDLTKVLQTSGSKAVYTAAKREDRQISDDFQVVWMPHLSLVDLQVTSSAYPKHQGIVRSMKSGPNKVSRGLRFKREDFREAFAELRPNDDVPSDIPTTFMFKISPVPLGAKHENVQTWFDGLSWKAKPLRLLASTVWLCASATMYESQFEMWDDQPILVRWMQAKPKKNQVVVAGNAKKITPPKPQSGLPESAKFDDPWAYYKSSSNSSTPNQSVPAAVTRKLQAPIEDRLSQQNTEWENFKEQQKVQMQELRESSSKEVVQLRQDVKQLKEAVATQGITFEKQNVLNAKEFSAIRSETKDQFAQLTASLQDSMKQSLARQDHTMASQFQELKTLLQNKEHPPKKQRNSDFNDPPHQLPAFSMFREMGAVEAFSWYKSTKGVDLPATCLGSTRNDTAIFHPQLVSLISCMEVDSRLQFDAHVPLVVTFRVNKDIPPARRWNTPCSWAAIAPPTELIDTCYKSKPFCDVFDVQTITDANQVGHGLLAWSHAVEVAIDKALTLAHRLNPVVHPWPSLHPKFRGRCGVKTTSEPTLNGGVRDDPTGAFNPDVEIFSLKAKQSVRQVRRLKSFRRALKAFSDTGNPTLVASRRQQLQHEWNIILDAKGFGSKWSSWILSYELIPYIPCGIPDMNLLDLCVDITEMHCNLTCQQEARNRYQSFRQRIRVDHDDGFLSLSYKIVRGQSSPPLTEVPFEVSSPATLLRSRKNQMCMRLANDVSFHPGRAAFFGECEVKVIRQSGLTLYFSTTAHNLPTQADLTQKGIAMTTEEIQDAFNSFWHQFWLRDKVCETTSMDHWGSFVQEVLDSGLAQRPPIDVTLDSLPIWMETIHSLKSRKAHGIDGWRYEDLKKLPESCIQDLAKIMSIGAQFGLPACLMAAKTTLLAKVPQPVSLHQIRPITVLGVLYRVTGKVIFSQIAKSWQSTLPVLVSGGVPGRGVKDLAYLLKHKIERALSNKSQLGGFSLDLRKAFNTFPRLPICFLWERLGVPEWVCRFWLSSLMRMQRFPHLHNRLGKCLGSTTGAPEGDCLSVLAMLALATAFHARTATEEVSPHGYADNWGWMTYHIPSHRTAFIRTLRFATSLRLEIDFNKSWHWGITREFREACESLSLLFPSDDVPVKIESHVRDLGERFHYNGNIQLANVKDKILEAERRIKRVKNLPLDVTSKAALIQSSVWPMALYSADTAYLGMHHFHTLRSATLFAFVGKCNFASPWLACFSLSGRLLDPLLHVILVALRAVRRLASICPETALSIVRLAASFSGTRPFGPATTLRKYLDTIGWSISADAVMTGPDHLTLNLLTDSTHVLCRTVASAWLYFLVQNLSRKGTGDYIPHPRINATVMSKFPVRDQGILVRNLVGGSQTGMTQKQWDSDAVEKCPLCGEDDTRSHRLLDCHHLSHIRDQHSRAVEILQDVRPEWVYVPLARSSPDLPLQRAFLKTIKSDVELTHFETDDKVVFYTDGGAIHPNDPDARLASWAVVSDVSNATVPQIQMMQSFQLQDLSCPVFRVVATGVVGGRQSAARGELTAYLQALRAAEKYDQHVDISVVTDASYVCFVDFAIRSQLPGFPNHKTRNADLIGQIRVHWSARVKVFKTKSHRNFDDAQDWNDLWTIYGNHAADFAATLAIRQTPIEIRNLFQAIASFHKDEADMLHKVLAYLVQLNRYRDDSLKKKEIVGQPEASAPPQRTDQFMPSSAMGADALHFLKSFSPATYTMSFDPADVDEANLHGILQGANFSRDVVRWLAACAWPPDVSKDYAKPDDWGISWLELLFSFCLFTNKYPPVKTDGQYKAANFWNYTSDQALLQPSSARAASRMYYVFQQAILAMKTVTLVNLIPEFTSKKCTSLRRFGFKGTFAGLPCRPRLPNPAETIQTVFEYISTLGGSLTFYRPLTFLSNPTQFDHGPLTEISAVLGAATSCGLQGVANEVLNDYNEESSSPSAMISKCLGRLSAYHRSCSVPGLVPLAISGWCSQWLSSNQSAIRMQDLPEYDLDDEEQMEGPPAITSELLAKVAELLPSCWGDEAAVSAELLGLDAFEHLKWRSRLTLLAALEPYAGVVALLWELQSAETQNGMDWRANW
eukprot:s2347_g2.t1